MQTIRLRSQVGADGQIRVQLPSQLANQEIEIVLVYQPVESDAEEPTLNQDPLIGLFAGSSNLADQAEAILERDIETTSGWTWKSL